MKMSNIFVKQRNVAKLIQSIWEGVQYRKLHRSSGPLLYPQTPKDDKPFVVSSKDKLEPVVGLTIPEFVFSNIQNWENAPAFVSFTTLNGFE
jgi:hypothetical protein